MRCWNWTPHEASVVLWQTSLHPWQPFNSSLSICMFQKREEVLMIILPPRIATVLQDFCIAFLGRNSNEDSWGLLLQASKCMVSGALLPHCLPPGSVGGSFLEYVCVFCTYVLNFSLAILISSVFGIFLLVWVTQNLPSLFLPSFSTSDANDFPIEKRKPGLTTCFCISLQPH